ncbi:HupE/UreJ family protein [Robiginitalea sp. SC105]|uniref:HupE/UreJ family protein n=1 Tax=Robiginitalea sp. SC105 TaxID=2762332 RepID=UPI00163A4700|nr:HupE/UreJ family protein [Robiginitalea sp. SC105]MBC2838455.1 HupE/UreJ family protein [Robiginitalea sp. SC105]
MSGVPVRKGVVLIMLLLPVLASAHGIDSADQALLDRGGLLSYIWVGAKHMLTGFDHLLFLAGVIFYLKGFRDILLFITIFTLGHCITLIGATYMQIRADEHLVDACIALSVVYKGFENLGGFDKLLKTGSPNLLRMVFIFGLLHGLGLSTRLQSFDLGSDQFLSKILSFNVGVELGQVVALVPIVLLIRVWQKKPSYDAFYRAANFYLVIAGVGLFAYQLYGYLNTQ